MSAVLLAVFNEYGAADRVRTRLVSDGFPTDRVELTAAAEPRPRRSGSGGLRAHPLPAVLPHAHARGRRAAVRRGCSRPASRRAPWSIVVHPRGAIETERATEILEDDGAVEVVAHDLDNQSFEHAAARTDGYWVRHFMPENTSGADCIYCRLLPGGTSTDGRPLRAPAAAGSRCRRLTVV